jgi:hypothetical protein
LILRLQHEGFGKEIRELVTSADSESMKICGIVLDEIVALEEARAQRQPHPKEEHLHGNDLSHVHYLKLKTAGNSIRIYFCSVRSYLYMLALDVGKRRTNITDGLTQRLIARSAWASADADAQDAQRAAKASRSTTAKAPKKASTKPTRKGS